MSTQSQDRNNAGGGKYAVKMILALFYVALCAVAESSRAIGMPQAFFATAVTGIIVGPLLVIALMYRLWWSKADEYQRLLEYRAMAGAGMGGVGYLVAIKLMSYFRPEIAHVPSLAVLGMVLVLWIHSSHRLNTKAMES